MSDPIHVIVVEDDQSNRQSYTKALSKEPPVGPGYRVHAFDSANPAIEHLRCNPEVSLVITDLMLPGIDGFGVLAAVRAIDPDIGVLMITGHGSDTTPHEAKAKGAEYYLAKPVDLGVLRQLARTIVEKRLASRERDYWRHRLGEKFGHLVGRSKSMETLFRQMEQVAPTRSNVLIVGESGTGKELVANALHENSPRRSERFLPINCAAIPGEILESELFGHEKGSFTGATGRKLGKFELADKGTLFLDEIGELPLDMQVKLLRVLEQREFMRVGGTENIKVDIRLIAATNQDLETGVEQGRFRSDLYYRLKVVTLSIPPLRERAEDIPILANHFLQTLARENGRESMRFSAEALKALLTARWEGNVRELRNLVESLVVLVPSEEIRMADLPEEYAAETTVSGAEGPVSTMVEIERQAIFRTLEQTGGNRTQAAELLGIGLRTLQRKLKEYREAGSGDPDP